VCLVNPKLSLTQCKWISKFVFVPVVRKQKYFDAALLEQQEVSPFEGLRQCLGSRGPNQRCLVWSDYGLVALEDVDLHHDVAPGYQVALHEPIIVLFKLSQDTPLSQAGKLVGNSYNYLPDYEVFMDEEIEKAKK